MRKRHPRARPPNVDRYIHYKLKGAKSSCPTLYKEQWEKLLAVTDEIKAFIDQNQSHLKTKE